MDIKQYERLCERDGVFADGGYDPHHCFFKSQYSGEDRNGDWNYVLIRRGKHNLIHHAGTVEGAEKGKKLDIYLKKLAYSRYEGVNKEKLRIILRRVDYGVK